jgi:cation diffusion facilitator CzcD-associated flavoprotein CzcO
MSPAYDAVVVGAGPYGLSAAAHLRGRGLRVAVFGRTLGMWRDHMPTGMRLRSHWWATNLSDPRKDYGFERFLRESKHEKRYPLPIETFIAYGLWFQQRAVPDVDETYVASIQRQDAQFLITLEDGREVESQAVVMAIGLYHYANRPEQFHGLPAGLVSHSSDHRDFRRFKGRDVVVIGRGQSAIEFAALLHEAGAAVQVVSRRPIKWLEPDRSNTRSTLERVLAPDASIAPGWINWLWDQMPVLFYRFPQKWKDSYNARYHSGATDWLRERILGKVTLRERRTVATLELTQGKLAATIVDGAKVSAHHIILATGYTVDISKLTMIHPSLRAEIKTDKAIPILSHRFESSVPGLFFVGLTSVRAFGPLYRFVAGCGAAARRVASSVARECVERSRATPERAAFANRAAHDREAPSFPKKGAGRRA